MKNLLKRLMTWSAVSRNEWEMQYREGYWTYLNDIAELGHYSVIIGYIQYFDKSGSVLDVGCGEGVLQGKLQKSGVKRYVGLDLSEQAIQKAKQKENGLTTFTCSTVEDFLTAEKFDTIVFNEILYYLDDPAGTVKRYEQYLNEQGIIVISMFANSRSRLIWKRLSSSYSFVDETKIINKKGNIWICKCFQKP